MKTISRRQLLSLTAATAVAIPLSAINGRAFAGGHAKLDPNDAQAKALSYTHESPDAAKNCANCQLYTGGDAEWGPCAIFPGKEVAAMGWCSAWVAKA